MDYLEERNECSMFRWWSGAEDGYIDRTEIADCRSIGVLASDMGDARWLAPEDPAFSLSGRSSLFYRINWDREPGRKLLDVESTPALYWERGSTSSPVLTPSQIGSQAESLKRVSDEYRRWVNRVMSWVRRNGVAVWDCSDPSKPIPHGDVNLPFVNTVYALPGANRAIKDGALGRSSTP